MRSEFIVTQKIFKDWIKEDEYDTRKPPLLKLVFLVMAAAFLVYMIRDIIAGVYGTALYQFAFIVFCLYFAFFREDMVYNRKFQLKQKIYGKPWIRTVIFDEEKIYVKDGLSVVEHDYEEVTDIREEEDKVWIDLRDGAMIRLFKSGITESTWEECKAFIEERK